MDTFNFVPSDQLIASVLEDLSSYDANNQLDSGRWHPWIQKVVADLGIAAFKPQHALVYIKNYQGDLPCDFVVLDSAFLVQDKCHYFQNGIVNYQGRSIIWDDTTSACAYQTKDDCNGCEFRTCETNSFNEVTLREYVKGLPATFMFPTLFPLHVNKRVSKSWCLPSSICFGSRHKQEITIANKTVYTNFEEYEGETPIILLNYYAYPLDENKLPMIPDNPKVQLAVEHYIKWKAFENMWVNNDDMAVEKKMSYFKNEFEQNSYPDAEYLVKLTSMNTMMDNIRNTRHSLDGFQLIQK